MEGIDRKYGMVCRMDKISELQSTAKKIRIDCIEMIYAAGSGHPGSSLSAADILTVLYFYKMRYDPKNPKWSERDRFIMSKGHGAPAFYACLAEAGFFPKQELFNLRKIGHMLQGHPSNDTPGVEVSTGSLGQGLSVANGIALAGRLDKKDYRTYVLMGDGELQEGSVWEAALAAAHYKLDNLAAIIDRNRLQQTGETEKIMKLEDLQQKFSSFGWNVIRVNGHDIGQLMEALDEAESAKGRPTMIIADTVKGKGVSFMENKHEWHGVAPNKEEYERAIKELGDQ